MARFVLSHEVAQAWADAGIIDDIDSVRRIVLDLQVGEVPTIYTERFGDARLLSVTQTLEGVQIRRDPDPAEVDRAVAEASEQRTTPIEDPAQSD